MNLDQFRARPLVVTVTELCPNCQTLKDGVKLRDVMGAAYKSCEPCFEAEKRNRSVDVDYDCYGW